MTEFIDKTSTQRFADELSRRQEVVTTPLVVALEESGPDGAWQSPERPSTPMIHSHHVPQTLTLAESPRMQGAGSPEVALPSPLTRQIPTTPGNAQTHDQSSVPVRLSRSQKFKAKRAAKKQPQEAQEEPGAYSARVDVTAGLP